MISWPLIKYVMTAARRDRLALSLLAMMVVAASLSLMLGSTAVLEKNNFAVVFTSSGLRFAGVLGLVLFVVFYVRRAFETKDVEYLLSRPISKTSFVISHGLAFSLIAILTAAIAGFTIFGIIGVATPGFLTWTASIAAEFVIMVNVALFFAMVLPSATMSTLATLALYVLARLMGELLGIIDHGTASQVVAFPVLSYALQAISLIVPRLDLMGQTSWLIYPGVGISYAFLALQTVIYSCLVWCAAVIDLSKRQF